MRIDRERKGRIKEKRERRKKRRKEYDDQWELDCRRERGEREVEREKEERDLAGISPAWESQLTS